MRHTAIALLIALPLFALAACAGDKDDGDDDDGAADDSGGDDGGGTAPWGDANCPDDVPEQYQNTWDCKANACDPGDPVMYRYGTGASEANGDFSSFEQVFMFWQEGDSWDYCVEEWDVSGSQSSYDVETFNCVSCEWIYDVTWEMQTANACNLIWGSMFIDDEEEIDGPFDGIMMGDTHNSFGDRNPEDAMILYGYAIDGSYYYQISGGDYGRGTASPTTEVDGPPEALEWVGNVGCLSTDGGGGTKSAAGAAGAAGPDRIAPGQARPMTATKMGTTP